MKIKRTHICTHIYAVDCLLCVTSGTISYAVVWIKVVLVLLVFGKMSSCLPSKQNPLERNQEQEIELDANIKIHSISSRISMLTFKSNMCGRKKERGNLHLKYSKLKIRLDMPLMVIRVVEFSSGVYKIRKIFA